MSLQPRSSPLGRTGMAALFAGLLLAWTGVAATDEAGRTRATSLPPVLKGQQGDMIPVTVSLAGPEGSKGRVPEGRLDDQVVPFFALDSPGRYGGLIGIDLAAPAGRRLLQVRVGSELVLDIPVIVEKREFPVQKLTLPDEMVHLGPETLDRVKRESSEALTTMAPVAPSRWWTGAFLKPTEGPVGGSFGRRRVINGEPRSPHTGEDISAPEGSAVQASNGGIVRLTADHYFSGKSIFLDHGAGLYTMYFHLSKILVEPDQHVDKGQVIGLVGSSGRATGAHLHWGARLNGSRIDPMGLTTLVFP
jgi:hypothetical protein